MQKPATCWHNCYDGGWQGYLTPEAFAHPAKFSRALITRIFRHMLAEGMLRKGDVVVDPFGGVACGGIVAASMGLRWLGCELEERFVKLGQENIALHRVTWEACGDPLPVLVQGDSRRLREAMGGVLAADCIVSSPPYYTPEVALNPGEKSRPEAKIKRLLAEGKTREAEVVRQHGSGQASNLRQQDYGQTPGQLGAMKPGDVAAVVSSPPYVDGCRQQGNDNHPERLEGHEMGVVLRDYGDAPGQLSTLPAGEVAAVVTSPPYEGSLTPGNENDRERRQYLATASGHGKLGGGQLANANRYGTSPGQLGEDRGETFWHAARLIVQECHAILRPGGYSAWVVKAFVRNKQIVDFPGDWRKLCESVGFELVEEVHAMLVKEERHPDLFGGESVKRTERKSFFRRLAESKGSPRIDFEVVQFFRKP